MWDMLTDARSPAVDGVNSPCVWAIERKDQCMKFLGLSLVLGMILVLVLQLGYWRRTPYTISAQWDRSVERGLDPEDMRKIR